MIKAVVVFITIFLSIRYFSIVLLLNKSNTECGIIRPTNAFTQAATQCQIFPATIRRVASRCKYKNS